MVCSFGPVRTLPVVYVSAVIDGGSHPFPFRTRKLSLLSPMVLGLRARESRSLQDSRPLGRKRPRGLFFMPASLRSALATMPGQYRALVAHAPCLTARGAFCASVTLVPHHVWDKLRRGSVFCIACGSLPLAESLRSPFFIYSQCIALLSSCCHKPFVE